MLLAVITQAAPGDSGSDRELFSKEKGERRVSDHPKPRSAHGIGDWGLAWGLHPCWDTVHQALVLNMSPNPLAKKKKKGWVCFLSAAPSPQVSHAGSSSERAWQELRAVYSLSQDPNLGPLPLSDHQKLEREARICRLLKHPNIGEHAPLAPHMPGKEPSKPARAPCLASLPPCPPMPPPGLGGSHQ